MANTVQLPGTQLGLDESIRIGPGLKRNHYDGSIHVTEVHTGVVFQSNKELLVWNRERPEPYGLDGRGQKTLYSC